MDASQARGARDGLARWLLCCGASQFLEIATQLVSRGCAGGIDWEPVPGRAMVRLSRAADCSLNVVVSEGCLGESVLDVAAAAASSRAAAFSVLCVRDAPGRAASAQARGVDATVTPEGFGHLLQTIFGRDVAREELFDETLFELEEPLEAGSLPVPSVRPAGWPGRVEPDGYADAAIGAPVGGAPGMAAPRSRGGSLDERLPGVGDGEPPIDVPFDEGEARGRDADAPQDDGQVPTLCLASARGGVGKSTLAVLMALSLASEGLRVALIDLDYQFGTCLGFLGLAETDGLPEAWGSKGEPSLDARLLARCRAQTDRGLLAYEFCRLPERGELLVPLSGRIVRAARAGADLAIVDLPAGMTEGVAQVLEAADRCLIVGDQQALSLESMAAAVALTTRLGIPRTKIVAVLNRCDPRHRDENFLSRARFELQAPQIMRVVDGGPEVTRMLEMGCASELMTMRNRCALSAADLASALRGELGCHVEELAVPPAFEERPAQPRRPKARRASRKEVVPCP